MANIDPVRRAEIGREKKARTRAQLIAAARSLFARYPVEAVTVDDVVKEAGVAKGTFYGHFDDLQAMTIAVAEELVRSMDDVLQPARLSLSEPAHRIAFGCCCFIDKGLSDPAWAAVVARMLTTSLQGAEGARRHLLEDLTELSKERGKMSPALSLEIVIGIMLQLAAAISQGRLSWRDREAAIAAILRAIGLDARQVNSSLMCLPKVAAPALPVRPAQAAKRRQRTS
jgi:AcrR family transcriptional regulator